VSRAGDISFLGGFFFDADLQRAKELRVLVSEPEFGIGAGFGIQLLAMNTYFATFVETDGDFQDEKEVVTGASNSGHHVSDFFGVRKRLIDGVAQFLDQAFEVVIELQDSPDFLLHHFQFIL